MSSMVNKTNRLRETFSVGGNFIYVVKFKL